MLEGIDFSFGGGLTTAQIKAGGKAFVARYLSGGNTKDISAAELAAYHAAGLAVVFVWETDGIMRGSVEGGQHAQAADAQLRRIGAPGAVVFFAADAQVVPDLTGYLHTAAAVLGHGRTGLYGGLGNITAAFSQGLISYGWQTYAWSGGQWDNRARLRQYHNDVQFGPARVDLDQAAFFDGSKVLGPHDDYGQWPRPSAPAPQLPPDPKPAPDSKPAPSPPPPAPLEDAMPELDTTVPSHPLLIPYGTKTMDLLSVATEADPCVVQVTFLSMGSAAKEYSLSWGTADTTGQAIEVPAGIKKARLDVVSGGGTPVSVRYNS